MIFRLTLKLSEKIGLAPSQTLPSDKNPYADWSAHLFTAQRLQYIILTNTASLYSMVMFGRGMSNDKYFVQGALTCMREFMAADENKNIFQTHIEPLVNDISFSRITDRRVMGSMNDFVFQAKVCLNMGESPFNVSFLLNKAPMSYLKYRRPKDAFKDSITLFEGF